MSELNATFRVDEPVFEWKKTTAKSPTKSQKQVKIRTAAPKNIATPCRVQRMPVNAVPEKAKGVTMPKVMGSPGRVPVTQTSATPCRDRNSVRHTICGTPSTANKNLAAVSVTPAGPSRVPVTQATPYRDPISMRYTIYATPSAGNVNPSTVSVRSVGPGRVPVTQATATPYNDPNLLRRTIYGTPSGNENRTAMSVTSARRTLPPPQRVPVSEAKPGKSLTKSGADKVQKLLDFEEEDSKQ